MTMTAVYDLLLNGQRKNGAGIVNTGNFCPNTISRLAVGEHEACVGAISAATSTQQHKHHIAKSLNGGSYDV